MSEQKKVNAASRLLKLFRSAVSNSAANVTQFQVWVSAFGLQGESGQLQKRKVMRGVDLMHSELDEIVEQLREMGHPEEMYGDLVHNFYGVVSFEWLNHQWNSDLRPRLERTLYPLVLISNILPNQEALISPDELQEIEKELVTLEHSLNEKDISPQVRNFVMRQVERIRTALWEYRIRGIRAFEDGFVDAVREYSSSIVAQEHKDDEPVKAVSNIWSRMWVIVERTAKVGGALEAMKKIFQLAEHVGIHHHWK
jgi:hypothetical protein